MSRYLVPKIAFEPALARPAVAPGMLQPWPALVQALAAASRATGEFGLGDGEWLASQAAASPDELFLGVEAVPHFFRIAAERVERMQLRNVWLAMGDARIAIPWLAPASLTRAVWLFPDPWTKKRHNRRRMLAPQNSAYVARALRVGGELMVRSDVPEYIEEAETNFVPLGFTVTSRTRNTDPAAALTRWERRKLADGLLITQICLAKQRELTDAEQPPPGLPVDPRGMAAHEPRALRAGGFAV